MARSTLRQGGTVLDDVLGADNFLNEITWKRSNPKSHITINYPTCTDAILYYSKTDKYTFRQPYGEHDPEYVESAYRHRDERGEYRLLPPLNPNDDRPNLRYEFLGVTRVWRWTKERMQEAYQQGLIVQTRPGAVPQYKKYLADSKGRTVTNCWTDIPQAAGNEAVGYPTQKPEALLERIINASSNEGDLVLDCFCGSGTTAAVAEKLGRRWIAADLGRFAIHTTRKRLLGIESVRPFVVQNLGKYERQAWQTAEFANGDQRESAAAQLAYRRFMLDLYRAQPLDGYAWLHGVRDGRFVHVGSVDAPVALGDVQNIVREVWKARAGAATTNTVEILGWEFGFELNEVARQMAEQSNVHVRFKRIPREVLEKKTVEQGDIKFFELAALSLKVTQKNREGLGGEERAHGPHVAVTLTDFMVSPDDVPEDVQRAVTHWSQWIDYWAVDWDYRGDAFHNMAQTYRTRKNPNNLQTTLAHTYEEPGEYTIVVKVIDILGNDTTKSLKVEVR